MHVIVPVLFAVEVNPTTVILNPVVVCDPVLPVAMATEALCATHPLMEYDVFGSVTGRVMDATQVLSWVAAVAQTLPVAICIPTLLDRDPEIDN
jgi:hypothetical protein